MGLPWLRVIVLVSIWRPWAPPPSAHNFRTGVHHCLGLCFVFAHVYVHAYAYVFSLRSMTMPISTPVEGAYAYVQVYAYVHVRGIRGFLGVRGCWGPCLAHWGLANVGGSWPGFARPNGLPQGEILEGRLPFSLLHIWAAFSLTRLYRPYCQPL